MCEVSFLDKVCVSKPQISEKTVITLSTDLTRLPHTMARPANTGWQGGAPVLMDHEYDGYKALPLGKISSTSFSFEEAPVRINLAFLYTKSLWLFMSRYMSLRNS